MGIILIFSKGSFSRKAKDKQSTITRDDFLEWTKSVWTFPAISARKVGHPAPFPEELPHRLIQLYTYTGDVVLDPFAGSGTTCLSAKRDGRHFIGYEINQSYIQLAEERLKTV
jgi:site-specific DNA-methyltransferase (adenine-specific)